MNVQKAPCECGVRMVRHVVCRPQIEVEVWPAHADVYFRDDRGVNPINTQIRFDATVFNSSWGAVAWEVRNPAGHAGAGTIDPTGLYQAPPKGTLPSKLTDVVVATSREDPLRQAYAWVTLLGEGPEVPAAPRIEIWPRTAYLYYPENQASADRNEFIDISNKMQLFRATIRNSSLSDVEWLVDNVPAANTGPSSLFLYRVTGSGTTKVVVVTARLAAQPAVREQAKVVQINYRWPKMAAVSAL